MATSLIPNYGLYLPPYITTKKKKNLGHRSIKKTRNITNTNKITNGSLTYFKYSSTVYFESRQV